MKPQVYLETSVISVLAARPSRDPVLQKRRDDTDEWWSRRDDYRVCMSAVVEQEARAGDPQAAERRIEWIEQAAADWLSIEGAEELARELVTCGVLAPSAVIDAVHVAVATIHRVKFVLSWDLRHLANAMTRRKLLSFGRERSWAVPLLVTPRELLGEEDGTRSSTR